jgi:hypothetical protein
VVELNHKRFQNKHIMSTRGVIHINGQEYDAASGKILNKKSSEPIPKVQAPNHNSITHRPKPSHAHHAPIKSMTLSRAGVKKPKIFSDIRRTPIIDEPPKPSAEHIAVKLSAHSPKVVHFAKIEPRMIDTTPPPDIAQSYPDSPPPIMHHVQRSRVEAHIKRQLTAATAHQLSPHKKVKSKTRRKKASVLASGLAILALAAGFIAYSNISGLSVNLASRRAGFSAALPKFTPGGFKLNNHMAYGSGRVVLSFHSNTDDRQYQIEQTPTQLSSEGLKKQVEADAKGNYQTIDAGGVSIFFTDNNARWAKDGVLFSLTGESGLSSSQIASIASSL